MAAADNDYFFRELLRAQMELDGRSPRRLARDANDSWGHIPGFEPLTTATIRNWIRNRNPSTPRDWKQLAAILQELGVSLQQAEEFFGATTRSFDIDDLRNDSSSHVVELLTFRNGFPLVPSEVGFPSAPTKAGRGDTGGSLDLVPVSGSIEQNLRAVVRRVKRNPYIVATAALLIGAVGSLVMINTRTVPFGATTKPTTTQKPVTAGPAVTTTDAKDSGPPVIEIEGPAVVECWSGNEQYELTQTGGQPVTDWAWDAGGLGLQSPWNNGPEGVLSFDRGPGRYTIRVHVNRRFATAEKTIEVKEALGCSGKPGLPQPRIDGSGQVVCGSSIDYELNNNGGPITEIEWISETIDISNATDEEVTLTFPTNPGYHQVTAEINNEISTTRTIFVVEGPDCE